VLSIFIQKLKPDPNTESYRLIIVLRSREYFSYNWRELRINTLEFILLQFLNHSGAIIDELNNTACQLFPFLERYTFPFEMNKFISFAS